MCNRDAVLCAEVEKVDKRLNHICFSIIVRRCIMLCVIIIVECVIIIECVGQPYSSAILIG